MRSITLEQSLLSALLRLLTLNTGPEDAVAANNLAVLDPVAALAGGDTGLAAKPLAQLEQHLAAEEQPTVALVELLRFGCLDVTGVIRGPEGPRPVWAATPTGEPTRG
jgi:hypothetical protein